MKSLLRFAIVALALGLALAPFASRAAGPTVEMRVSRLDELVTLTGEQKKQAADVFRKEDAELTALTPQTRPLQGMEARQASRDRVRALLTPAQQKIYDRAPQMRGGGLTLATPENRVAALDANVSLTAAQKGVALQVYREEFESLIALPPADRPMKGMPFRQAARDQVRALLTPAQLAKMDGDRQTAVAQASEERNALENLLRASKNLTARIGSIVRVSPGGSSVSEVANGLRRGTSTLNVVGSTGSETLEVAWEKTSAQAEIRILRATIKGEAFAL